MQGSVYEDNFLAREWSAARLLLQEPGRTSPARKLDRKTWLCLWFVV